MRFIPSLLLFSLSAPAFSAPFLASEPYPAGSPQPDEFAIAIGGQAAPVISPAFKEPDGSVRLKYDLSGLTGPKAITVRTVASGVQSEPTAAHFIYCWPATGGQFCTVGPIVYGAKK